MNVIRGGDANTVVRSAIVLDLGDLKRQAEIIKDTARLEAAQILEEAKADADRLIESASERGFAKGDQEGRETGFAQGLQQGSNRAYEERSAELESLCTTWNTCLHEFLAIREQMLTSARADVIDLVLKIAERVVYRVIECDPSVIDDQIEQALRLVARKTDMMIEVNPEDLDAAQKLLPNLVSTIEGCGHAEVQGDHTINRGGCYIRCGNGAVDATIETQIARVTELLLPTTSGEREPSVIQISEPDETTPEGSGRPVEAEDITTEDAADRDGTEGEQN